MRIYIEDFQFKAIIGILDFEREETQDVVINLVMDYNYSNGRFIDYVEIRDLIKEIVIDKKFTLLEDALIYITTIISEKYPISYIKLKITKPSILSDAKVSVEMEKSIV